MTTETQAEMRPELLGEIVTWDVECSILSYNDVIQSLSNAGLDPDAAKEMSPRSAFGRAVKDLKKERAIDKVTTEHGVIKFQFTGKAVKDGRVDYDYECMVELNTDTGAIKCQESPQREAEIQSLFAHAMQTRNAQDVSRMVQRLFQDHADLYPINKRKGVAYFVPEQHREFSAKVDAFLKGIGGALSRFPVPKGTPEGNASVRDAVSAGLAGLVAELNQTVEEWDDTTRSSTMDKALERWKVINHKVEAYATYLESKQGDLLEQLEQAKEKLRQRVLELHPEDADEKEDATTTATAA